MSSTVPHVLVVEDERVNAVIIQRLLERESYRVTVVPAAEPALDIVRGDSPPDLVLLDVVLPGMSGIEACKLLQQDPRAARVPVIFLTARIQPEDVAQAFEVGAVDYIPKPFRPPEALARIRTQLRLHQLRLLQERTIAELESANEARNRFLGMAAHDLRSPLAGIQGLAELLAEGEFGAMTADQKEATESIARASRSMLGLINDLLDLSTVAAGVFRLEPTPGDPRQLLERTLRTHAAGARRKGIQLETSDTGAPETWIFDTERLQQVVDNLVSNAIKYSTRDTKVRITLGMRELSLHLAVQDEGPGVPEKERPQLFRDFGRTSARPTGGEGSTGLGLAICSRIIAAHGGRIGHEPGPSNRGSVFWFELDPPTKAAP